MQPAGLPHSWLPLAALAGASLCAGALTRVRMARRRAWYRDVYLRSPYWRARRARAIARAGGRCERCGVTGRLEVHHLTYARLGRERDRDLRALCHGCHRIAERRRRARRAPMLGWLLGRLVGWLTRRRRAWSPGGATGNAGRRSARNGDASDR